MMKSFVSKLISFLLCLLIIGIVSLLPISSKNGIVTAGTSKISEKPFNPATDIPEIIRSSEDVQNHTRRLYEKEEDLCTLRFENGDGSETVYLFEEPVKFIAADGTVCDKSNGLTLNAADCSYVNTQNDIQASFPVSLSSSSGIKLRYGDFQIEVIPHVSDNCTAYKTVNRDGIDCVTYSNAFGQGVDLLYHALYLGIKEEIILPSPTITSFSYEISCSPYGLEMVNGVPVIIDTASSEIIARISQVNMFDSYSGTDEYQHDSFNNSYEISSLANGNYLVTVNLDVDFLNDERTVYPVIVDPTITINASGSGSSKTILDTPIYNGSGVTNITSGSNPLAIVGQIGLVGSTDYGVGRLLIRFPGLMNKSFMNSYFYTVTSASLHVNESSGKASSSSLQVYLYKGSSWNESSVYSSSIWNGKGRYLTYQSFSYPNATNGNFNITWAVQYWQSNTDQRDKGLMIVNTNEASTTAYKALQTTEGSPCPYLSVTYAARSIASGAYTGVGVSSTNITLRLVGGETTNATWRPIIIAACSSWSNSSAGVQVTPTLSGTSPYTISVGNYPIEDCAQIVFNLDYTGFEIQVRNSMATNTNIRKSTVAHEIGHAFGLEDNPTTTDISLMTHTTAETMMLIFIPQMIDIYHVRQLY